MTSSSLIKMAKVHMCNVVVFDNPSPFLNPFQFEVTFECIEDLKEDLEWKMIYVGSAESEEYDQVLDTVYVGPVAEGRHMFVFQADPPDVRRIPEGDALGVTVVLLTCSYRKREFVTRNILASEPRVTRFKIDWDDAETKGESSSKESPENELVPEEIAMGGTDTLDGVNGEEMSEAVGSMKVIVGFAAGADGNSSQGSAMEVM
ncbi:hypothetical protein J437_LFUL004605 [Ladona fulva]|uniref:Uncharacterized protein n=1 Tax=Ladona fulva TaxID=123851 RepID=A0A8K0K121_LADFU|nr:hypothetical protein J437_LFUL004605 [Ladona fulva]